MRKIYLVMLSLCVALAANAAADQLYMFGSDEQIGKWDLSKKAQMTQTESGVFEITLVLDGAEFGFTSSSSNEWDGAGNVNKCRLGADKQGMNVGEGEYNTHLTWQNNWIISAGKWKFTVDTNSNKLKIEKLEEVEIDYAYAIKGNIFEGSDSWETKAMTEENGKWSLTAKTNGSGSFAILAYKNGDANMSQLLWINSTKSSDIQPNVPASVGIEHQGGKINFNWTIADEFTFEFDPKASTLTVINENVLPEPEYNGPTTVFFDNSGTNWATVYVYCWKGSDNNANWPGVEITANRTADGLYFYKAEKDGDSKDYDGLIFAEKNGGAQTDDLIPIHGHVYSKESKDMGHRVFDAPATTTVAVATKHGSDITLTEGEISGKTSSESFTLSVSSSNEAHELFYRVFATDANTPSYAAAGTVTSFAGYKPVENGEISIPCGNGTLGVSTREYGVLSQPAMFSYTVNQDTTGVEDILVEEGVREYYNLNGVKVAEENLTPGCYIVRCGNKVQKVFVR